MPKKNEFACPIETVLQVIGGRWKTMILYRLFQGTYRYSDLQRAIPRITPKVLTQQLREMERDGLVRRTIYPEIPPRVEYNITPLGATLRPLMKAMCQWAKTHGEKRSRIRTTVTQNCGFGNCKSA